MRSSFPRRRESSKSRVRGHESLYFRAAVRKSRIPACAGMAEKKSYRRPGRFASITSQIFASSFTSSKRLISCRPVGEVTLISVI